MNRIDCAIEALTKQRAKALVAFLTAGYPTAAVSERAVRVLEKAGADMIELGMPFSDPIADGPTIQEASALALRRGMSVVKFLRLVCRIRRRSTLPIIMMTYYNPLFRYGLDRFCRDAAAAGLDGVIVPDLPVEEADELNQCMRRRNLRLIFLVSPLTGGCRGGRIAARSAGFVYYVSLAGVTGIRRSLPSEVRRNVRRLKRMSGTPVFVGFGISTPEQVRQVCQVADGAIVGSAIVQRLEGCSRNAEWARLGRYVRSLKQMTKGASPQ